MLTVEQVMGIISDKVAPLPPRAVPWGRAEYWPKTYGWMRIVHVLIVRSWMDLRAQRGCCGGRGIGTGRADLMPGARYSRA